MSTGIFSSHEASSFFMIAFLSQFSVWVDLQYVFLYIILVYSFCYQIIEEHGGMEAYSTFHVLILYDCGINAWLVNWVAATLMERALVLSLRTEPVHVCPGQTWGWLSIVAGVV